MVASFPLFAIFKMNCCSLVKFQFFAMQPTLLDLLNWPNVEFFLLYHCNQIPGHPRISWHWWTWDLATKLFWTYFFSSIINIFIPVACTVNMWGSEITPLAASISLESLNGDTRVVIYDRHMSIIQATGGQSSIIYLNVVHYFQHEG